MTQEISGTTQRRTKGNKGFTIVEMVIIVAVLAILMSIAVPNIARARQNAEDTRTQKELQSIYTAIVMFQAYQGRKPTSWAELDPYIRIPNAAAKYELNAG